MFSDSHISPFDKHAAEYDSWFDEAGKLVFETELLALEQVSPSLHKPWLEIGVGTGRFAKALEIETGLDLSKDMVEIASQRGITVFLASGDGIPLKNDSYNTVFLITTMCFLKSPASVLSEVYRILKPGGNLVLAGMPTQSPWVQLYERIKQQGSIYKYATFYSYNDFVSLVEKCGFFVKDVVSTLLQNPDRVTRVEQPQKGYTIGSGFVVIVAEKR